MLFLAWFPIKYPKNQLFSKNSFSHIGCAKFWLHLLNSFFDKKSSFMTLSQLAKFDHQTVFTPKVIQYNVFLVSSLDI